MTHFEFWYHTIAFFSTLEVRRLAIAKSDTSLKINKSRIGDVVSPRCYIPLCYPNGETPSCKAHTPVFNTQGEQIGGALLYKKAGRRTNTRTASNPWGGIPAAEDGGESTAVQSETQHSCLPDICFAFTSGGTGRFTPTLVECEYKGYVTQHLKGATFVKPVRDTRDGTVQVIFENNCTYAKRMSTADAGLDRYEYVCRQPSLTLSKDLAENDANFFAQAKRAAAIRQRLERSNPPRPRFEQLITERKDSLFGPERQWVPRIGPLTEDEATAWPQHGAEDHVYTLWVPKTQWFSDKVETMRVRIQASRELTAKNVLLDPLRFISNALVGWTKDTKNKTTPPEDTEKEKRLALHSHFGKWATTQNGHFSGGSGAGKKHREFIGNQERYTKEDDIWQPFRKGWQTHAIYTTELQWEYWDKWLHNKYSITLRMSLGEAEKLAAWKYWLTSRSGWFVPTVTLRENTWERYDKGVWENAEELLVRTLYTDHTAQVMESFKFERSCRCRFCRDEKDKCTNHFTSYTEMQKHEKECHPDKLVKNTCVPLHSSNGAPVDSEGLLKVKHSTHGNVLFLHALLDNRYAWVLHRKEHKKVNVSDLTVDGKTFAPPVAKYYAGMEASKVEGNTQKEYDNMLDYFLSVVYEEGLTYETAMKSFRANRDEVLSRNAYLFCDEIIGRPKPERHIDKHIDIYPSVTEYGTNWYLRIYPKSRKLPCVLALGKVASANECLTVYEALKHCRAKEATAKRIMDKPTKGITKADAEAEWLKWAVYTQVCHEAEGSWAADKLTSPDVFPYIVDMEAAIEDVETDDEMMGNSGDDEADALIVGLNSVGIEERKAESEQHKEELEEQREAGDNVPEEVDELVPEEEDESELEDAE